MILVNKQKKEMYEKMAPVLLSVIAVYLIIWAYTGQWPWTDNPYNSYILQIKAWLLGRADLGRDYSHLEIAGYNGNFYISFPPFPSLFLLPFFLAKIPDGFAAFAISLAAAGYAFALCEKCRIKNSLFWTLFLIIASNVLMVSVNAWVWFIAQNLSFLLTIMSIYYAVSKKGVVSLACWAFAIGCRPFQIIYLPLLLILLIDSDSKADFKKIACWFIIPAITAVLYMGYNYLRFDSVFEFGHNYLPEFLEAKDGQFNLSYIPGNLVSLLRLPKVGENGALIFPQFEGMSVFLCFPIIIISLLYSFQSLKNPKIIAGLCLAALQILMITSHKTMGGYHFGNRYFIDVMPFFFYIFTMSEPNIRYKFCFLTVPLFMLGAGLNIVGVISILSNV